MPPDVAGLPIVKLEPASSEAAPSKSKVPFVTVAPAKLFEPLSVVWPAPISVSKLPVDVPLILPVKTMLLPSLSIVAPVGPIVVNTFGSMNDALKASA